jgi:hypothetical protein
MPAAVSSLSVSFPFGTQYSSPECFSVGSGRETHHRLRSRPVPDSLFHDRTPPWSPALGYIEKIKKIPESERGTDRVKRQLCPIGAGTLRSNPPSGLRVSAMLAHSDTDA